MSTSSCSCYRKLLGLVAQVALVFAIVTAPATTRAAPGTLTGTIVDANGEPFANASVEVRDEAGVLVAQGSTDAQGGYTITADAIMPGATYNVCAGALCSTVIASAAVPFFGSAAGVTAAVAGGAAGATGLGFGLAFSDVFGGEEPAASLSQ